MSGLFELIHQRNRVVFHRNPALLPIIRNELVFAQTELPGAFPRKEVGGGREVRPIDGWPCCAEGTAKSPHRTVTRCDSARKACGDPPQLILDPNPVKSLQIVGDAAGSKALWTERS